MKEYYIILFDGVCNFCNYWVNFLIDHDKNDSFRFAALQSETGQKFLSEFKISQTVFDTFILIVNENHFIKSTAALKIAKKLPALWKLLSLFIIIPKPVRDFIYDLVAKNRYKLFGRRETCRVPSEENRKKFI